MITARIGVRYSHSDLERKMPQPSTIPNASVKGVENDTLPGLCVRMVGGRRMKRDSGGTGVSGSVPRALSGRCCLPSDMDRPGMRFWAVAEEGFVAVPTQLTGRGDSQGPSAFPGKFCAGQC